MKSLIKNIYIKMFFVVLCCILSKFEMNAANYYWRTAPVDNIYTNVANWETSPGGGVSPSVAPTINDDVFFSAALSTVTSINLNGGFAKDFNFAAAADFTFTGSFTITGSLTANGHAYFNIAGASSYNGTSGNTLTFAGSGTHTIDMGTHARRFTGGGAVYFTSNTSGGTYSLINHNWNTNNTVRFNTQNFLSNGFAIDVQFITVEGTTTRTVNFENSTINVNGTINTYSDNLFAFDLRSATATYNMTNTRVVANSTGIFQAVINVAVSIGSLTLNNGNTAVLRTFNSGGMNLSMDSLIVNNTALYLGSPSLGGSATAAIQTINAGVVRFVKPAVIENYYANTTFGGVHTIVEAPLCQGQSVFQSVQMDKLKLNTTTALTTTSIAYRAVEFGGSGVTTSASYDMGFNKGTIAWSGTAPSTTFYWVGGNGNWQDPTKWSILGSGGTPQLATDCIPTYNDDVIFDANSFTANQEVTITAGGAYCRNITFSDPANEGLIQSSVLGNTLNINGNADFTGARGFGNNVYMYFVGAGMHTITSGGAFTYNARQILLLGTGTYTLTDNFPGNMTTNGSIFYQFSGTFNTAGNDMALLKFVSKSHPSIPANSRNLDISNSVITQYGGLQSGDPFINVSYLNSFTATGSHIIQTNNAANFLVNAALTSSSPYNLASVSFNDLSFSLPSGTTTLQATVPVDVSLSYNNVHFASNANIVKNLSHNPFIVDTFWLSSGRLYQFTAGRTFTVTGAIEHLNTGCGDLVRINSLTAGAQTTLNKPVAPFNVNNAIVKDVNASGAAMNVIGGANAGNTTNVTVSPAIGRDMYWVNNTGNWSDGHGHWSIGVSGGDPAVTNPLGCIPRLIDNVFFDANSFSTSNQIVTIDIDAECKDMLWDAAAGSDNPRLGGISPRVLNVWGSLEFGAGMTAPYSGELHMMGASPVANAQSITTNAVSLNAQMNLNGGGRYDQLDVINFNSGISLNAGGFYTNGHNITAAHLYLDVRTPNIADISNSRIILNSGRLIPASSIFYTYYAYHSGAGNWNATGSYIQSNQREFGINNSVPVVYDTIVMNTTTIHSLYSTTAQNVTANWIEWKTLATTNTLGNFTTGVLIYQRSSTNNLQAGRTVLVTDSLAAYGTPCVPVTIQSATTGTQATLNSGNCNFDILFGNIRDIHSTTCTAAENKVVGTDAGNNSNWTFTNIAAFTPLGNDTTIECVTDTMIVDASGFGNDIVESFLWNTGAATSEISVTNAGVYWVRADYGASCYITDTIVVSCNLPNLVINNPAAACYPGTIDITAGSITAGSSPALLTFTYWENATATIPLADPDSITVGGPYYIVATNQAGYTDTAAVTVIINPQPDVQTIATIQVCSPSRVDLTEGSVTTGSTSGLTYTYFNSDYSTEYTAAEVSVIAATAVYHIVGTTASGCADTSSVEVIINFPPDVQTIATIQVCSPSTADLTEASVTAGSTSGLTYTYFNSDYSTEYTAEEASVISATDIYHIVGTTASGCADTSSVDVIINSQPDVQTIATIQVCSPSTVDLTTGSVTAGSTSGLTYTYFNSDYSTEYTAAEASVIAATDIYHIVGTTALGCADTSSVDVIINLQPDVQTIATIQVCSPSRVDLTEGSVIAGSTSGLTYTYFNSDYSTEYTAAEASLISGTDIYHIVGTTGSGCADTSSVDVIINPQPYVQTIATIQVCSPSRVDLTEGSVIAGSTSGLTYTYFNSDYSTEYTAAEASLISGTDIYHIVGTTGSGCADTSSVDVIINPQPDVQTIATIQVCSPSRVDLTAGSVIAGSTSGLTYTYFNSDYSTEYTAAEASLISGTAVYHIVGTTGSGCADTSSVDVIINPQPDVQTIATIQLCSPSTADLTEGSVTAGSTSGLTYTYFNSDYSTEYTAAEVSAISGTDVYHIVGTTASGCADTSSVDVIINPQPVIIANDITNISPDTTVDVTTAVNIDTGLTYQFYEGTNASGAVVSDVNVAISGDYSVIATNLTTGCSDTANFIVTIISEPLAVTLLNFEAYKKGNIVGLEWATGSEHNNKGFGVERSVDGRTWDIIGYVASKSEDGNSAAVINYGSVDKSPVTGANLYRLKQISQNGDYIYSIVRSVYFGDKVDISVIPNPTQDKATVINLPKGKNQLLLFNGIGQVLMQKDIGDSREFVVDLSQLASGVYYIHIKSESGNITSQKVVKQ